MLPVILLFSVVGLAIDIWFIKTEYSGNMPRATLLKGCASFVFVCLGAYCYIMCRSRFGLLVLIGLILGMVGDVFLNLRNQFEGARSNKIFAIGILAFLSGHFLYIASLIGLNSAAILPALILTLVLSVAFIPPFLKKISAPSKGLKIFGYVYLVIVTAMFSFAAAVLFKSGFSARRLSFFVGSALFLVSDYIMIYYSFGKKIKPLRAINLLCYYVGQLLIAVCICLT